MIQNQLILCRELRTISLQVLSEVVQSLRVGISTELDAVQSIINGFKALGVTDYWYPSAENKQVDQFGAIVVFDTVEDPQRTAFANGRSICASPEVYWNNIGYFYVSPQKIDPDTGQLIWGDFGCSIYLGKSKEICDYYRRCWQLSQSVILGIKDGKLKTTSDVVLNYEAIAKQFEVRNIAWSETGAASVSGQPLNIGHSFPDICRTSSASLLTEEMENIRNHRIFLDGTSEISLENTIWSLEPRDSPIDYPHGCISFHRLFGIIDGNFHLLADNSELFKNIGMQWVFE
jgi:hypothetical protein